MTKNIVIGFLIVLCLALGIYVSVLKIEVTQNRQIAEMNAVLAKVNEKQARQAEILAHKNAEEAKYQQSKAENAYQECLKRKK